MRWNEKELLKQIDDYFENVTPEEFDEALNKAGYGEIEPCSDSGYKMVELEEVSQNDLPKG